MTIKHADIIRAILDDKVVQERASHNDAWETVAPPEEALLRFVLTYPDHEFRVKPEPAVRYGYMPEDHTEWGYSNKTDATKGGSRTCVRAEFLDGKCVSVSLEDA